MPLSLKVPGSFAIYSLVIDGKNGGSIYLISTHYSVVKFRVAYGVGIEPFRPKNLRPSVYCTLKTLICSPAYINVEGRFIGSII